MRAIRYPIALVALCALAPSTSADYESLDAVPAGAMLGTGTTTATYRVHETAANDGWINRFVVESVHQRIEAYGDSLALERMQEQEALSTLKAVKGSEAYARGIESAAQAPIALTRQTLEDPVGVAKALPQGLSNILNDVSNALGGLGQQGSKPADHGEMIKGLLGYHRAKRRLAAELGIDPFSSNATLQAELNDVTWSMFAGGATIDLAIAGAPMAAGLAIRASASARNAPWDTPSVTLNKAAADALVALGLSAADAEAAVTASVCTLTHVTATVSALAAIGPVRDIDAVGRLLATARNEEDCRQLRELTSLAWLYHGNTTPLVALRPFGRGLLATDQTGRSVLVLRADHLRWTRDAQQLLDAVTSAAGKRLWLSGGLSEQAGAAAAARGFEIHARVLRSHPGTIDIAATLVPERAAAQATSSGNQTGKLVDEVGKGVGSLLQGLGGALLGESANPPADAASSR